MGPRSVGREGLQSWFPPRLWMQLLAGPQRLGVGVGVGVRIRIRIRVAVASFPR